MKLRTEDNRAFLLQLTAHRYLLQLYRQNQEESQDQHVNNWILNNRRIAVNNIYNQNIYKKSQQIQLPDLQMGNLQARRQPLTIQHSKLSLVNLPSLNEESESDNIAKNQAQINLKTKLEILLKHNSQLLNQNSQLNELVNDLPIEVKIGSHRQEREFSKINQEMDLAMVEQKATPLINSNSLKFRLDIQAARPMRSNSKWSRTTNSNGKAKPMRRNWCTRQTIFSDRMMMVKPNGTPDQQTARDYRNEGLQAIRHR